MYEFKQYRRKRIVEMRPYVIGEDLSYTVVPSTYDPIKDMGMIARNVDNHYDQWYIPRSNFNNDFELVKEEN